MKPLERTRLRIDREVDADLRVMLERIMERVNQLTEATGVLLDATGLGAAMGEEESAARAGWVAGATGATADEARVPVVNMGLGALTAGLLLGVRAGRVMLAQAGQVRASMICTGSAGYGQPIPYATGGVHFLRVERGKTATGGAAAWLSAVEGGTVTPTAPAHKQLIGVFQGEAHPVTGVAPVAVHIDLAGAR